MGDTIDPGPGYRLLCEQETIRLGDERMDGCDRPPRKWLTSNCGPGMTVAAYKAEYSSLNILAVRRRVAPDQPSELDTLREQVEALTAERDELRQTLADTTERLDERSERVRSQTDYSINLQKAIEAHCRGQEADSCQCPYHADLLNADLAVTEQRACEIVNQMRRRGRLEVSDECCGWFTPHGPDNWQCRPAQPTPVTKPVTLPPDKWAEIEAAIKAAGGSV